MQYRHNVESPSVELPKPVPSEGTSTPGPEQNGMQELVIQTKRAELSFAFGMTMQEAKAQLEHANIMYIEKNDSSYYRSWSGHRLNTDNFYLVFDIRGKLHEINITGKQETNLPVSLGELVGNVQNWLGEVAMQDWPEETTGLVDIEYCEYDMGGWYLRIVFDGECSPEEQRVGQVEAAQYSTAEYAKNENAAGLIIKNTSGEEATLSIGMTHDDVTWILKSLGVDWFDSADDIISLDITYSDDADGDGDPDEDDFIELSQTIYFDKADHVYWIESFGPGVRTAEGLAMRDSVDDMITLYGDDYTVHPLTHIKKYIYVYGDNYLYVSVDNVTGEVCSLDVLRYDGY